MQQLSIREMRSSLGKLDHLLEDAGELIVTRHGKAIARISPISPPKKRPSHSDLRRSMPYLNTASETLIRRDRDEG
ncbi:MAG: prevent-host-death protein [Pseudomonadota bacterium]|nr:prevent-host-death protein [Pseudomonadota bacterium]MEA3240900.1 prevent-host-death protein [Pseudomonadota bacterium]